LHAQRRALHEAVLKYIELEQHLKKVLSGSEEFAPLYVVYGADDYLKDMAIKQFEGILDKDYLDFNCSTLTVSASVDDLKSALETYPMFDSVRLVKYVAEGKVPDGVCAFFDEYVKMASPASICVVDADENTIRSFTQKRAVKIDCGRLDDDDLVYEINLILAKDPSAVIEPSATQELIKRTQGSMARIVSETEKLKAYSGGKITLADVKEMVVADIEYQTYEFADAIAEKNGNRALEMLNQFSENGLRGVQLINSIYDKYRKMFHTLLNKDKPNDVIAQTLGVRVGMVFYLKKSASNYTPARLKKCVDLLHSLQYDVLSGKRNEGTAIHEAVLELLAI